MCEMFHHRLNNNAISVNRCIQFFSCAPGSRYTACIFGKCLFRLGCALCSHQLFFLSVADYSISSVLKFLLLIRKANRTRTREEGFPMASNGTGEQMDDEDIAMHEFIHVGETYIIPTIYLIAIITNCISLFVLPIARIVRTFRICLVALTISDLFATTVNFCNSLLENIWFHGDIPHGRWDKRTVTLYVLYYLGLMFMCTSATIVIFIVGTRHWIVKNPLKARQITTRKTKWIVFGLFVLTFIIFIPTSLIIMYQSCLDDFESEECNDIHRRLPNLEKIFKGYLYTILTIYGPILIIVYITCLIGIRATLRSSEDVIRKLTAESQSLMDNQQSVNLRGSRASTPASRTQSTTKITRTLVMIVILDTICTLPTVVQGIANLVNPKKTVFSTTNDEFKVIDVVAEIFLAMRPAYNFWLYVFTHDEFKIAFEQRFCSKRSLRFLRSLPCYHGTKEREDTRRKISQFSSSSGSQDKSRTTSSTQV